MRLRLLKKMKAKYETDRLERKDTAVPGPACAPAAIDEMAALEEDGKRGREGGSVVTAVRILFTGIVIILVSDRRSSEIIK